MHPLGALPQRSLSPSWKVERTRVTARTNYDQQAARSKSKWRYRCSALLQLKYIVPPECHVATLSPASPWEVLNAGPLETPSRQRRPKKEFSKARPLGPRHLKSRGGPKWLETDFVGSPRPPENSGGGLALQILLGSCWVLTILGASFKGPAGASRIHQERGPRFPF